MSQPIRCPACGHSIITDLSAPLIAAAPVARPPALCPVCVGRGTVPADFYANLGFQTSTAAQQCRACRGRGVL